MKIMKNMKEFEKRAYDGILQRFMSFTVNKHSFDFSTFSFASSASLR